VINLGAWGPGISSNDTYADVHGAFFDLYNSGKSVGEISAYLISANQQTINNPDDCNNFWFALARAQWECKELDPELLKRITKIVDSGSDIEVWRRLDADKKTLAKRRIVLEKFLVTLSNERPKAKTRKKKVIRQPPFEKGDCLTFKLNNGDYGGAVVLEAIQDTEYGYSLLVTTRINQHAKPTKSDFESAEILIRNYEGWDNKPCISWYYPIRHKRIAHLIEKVDSIDVQIDYTTEKSGFSFMGDFDVWVIDVANQQFDWEKTRPQSTISQTIKAVTKKKPWKFW
jgi:hypothetical protein